MSRCQHGHKQLGSIGTFFLRVLIWLIENIIAPDHRVVVLTPCYIATVDAHEAMKVSEVEEVAALDNTPKLDLPAQHGQYL